jgi:acetate kinase
MKIDAVGHRVVHGKNIFREPVKITEDNLKELEKLNNLAPLHNPFNILGIKTCQKIFQGVPQIAVFDTEFFKDLPEVAYTYALPEEIVKEFGFRRYGFHGISHEYVAKKAADKIKKPFNKLKIITCHLGGGSSITAIKNGKGIDTSMGFTPMQGLVMMTRTGDMDLGVVLGLAREFTLDKATEILNKESGVKGICGQGDMLKVLEMAGAGDKKAKLALDVFVYSVQKYIGAYCAILGGCDALVFTGSIGSGSKKIRDMIYKNLEILKKTKILAIETDEEFAIVRKIINLKF